MTSAQVPSRIAIKRPFAESGLITPIQDASGNSVNYPQGFPSIYGVPASEGGKYVGRGDINAIGNVATNDLFYHKCGGINTFDAAFSAKVGGYPKGAVLQYLNGTNIYNVISLVDNNTFDFVANNSIDGTNWAYCNEKIASNEKITISELNSPINELQNSSYSAVLFDVVSVPKSGNIIVESDYFNGLTTLQAELHFLGFVVFAKKVGSPTESITLPTPTSHDSWTTIYSNVGGTGTSGIDNRFYSIPMIVDYGDYLALAYAFGTQVSARGSYLKIKL